MYTNIYEALRSGRTAEDLVKDFTAAMNEAEERVRKEDEEARLAAEAEKAAEANKVEDFTVALRTLCETMQKYYPELELHIAEDDEYEAAAQLVIQLLDLEHVKLQVLPTKKVRKVKPKTLSSDDVFADFFKTLGF